MSNRYDEGMTSLGWCTRCPESFLALKRKGTAFRVSGRATRQDVDYRKQVCVDSVSENVRVAVAMDLLVAIGNGRDVFCLLSPGTC